MELIGKFEGVKFVIMSVAEMKKAIMEKVEKLSSPDQLDVVLEALNRIENKKDKTAEIDIDALFEDVSARYGNTLRRLAE